MTTTTPELKEGEIYIGAIINPDGTGYHSILLPGDKDDDTWNNALAWAIEQGGDLPNRIEQAILFDKFKDQFQEDWYWSNTEHASHSDYAWFQNFLSGYQVNWYESFNVRARAVRRLIIE